MHAFVHLTLFAAWFYVINASPLPVSKYSDSASDQTVYTAEDHLFHDETFPLRERLRPHTQEFGGFADEEPGKLFHVPSREQTPMNDPFSGFFFDMQDMMKILRDQMSEVLARSPPKAIGNEDHLRPSDVQNQSTTRVEYLDGHKVVINDTTYSNGDTNHGSIFHVQIVDLLPMEPSHHTPDDFFKSVDEPSTPKTKISNEIDGWKVETEERDREEVEEDDDEIGEDNIDELSERDLKNSGGKGETPKEQPKKEVKEKDVKEVKEVKEKPKDVKDVKEVKEKEGSKNLKVVIEKDVGKNDKKVVEEEVLDETDDEEDEDEPTKEEEKTAQPIADAMETSESRWQNEIDNRIDTNQPYYNYQPSYNTYKQNYNRVPNFYYEPYYKSKVDYSTYQPSYNPDQPKFNSHQPIYNTAQPNFNSHQPAYNPNQPKYNSFEPAYKPDLPSYHSYQPTHPKDNDRFIDLSGDTKVNDFMADQQQAGLIMIDPDAEIIDINKKPVPKLHYPRYNYRKY